MCFITVRGRAMSIAALLLLQMAASGVRGEPLTAELYQNRLLFYEPIVLRVQLTFEEPLVLDPQDAHRTVEEMQKLRRRLIAELTDENGDLVAVAPLPGLEFVPVGEGGKQFQALALGFLGDPTVARESYLPWAEAGSYQMVVRDRESPIQSAPLSIEIGSPAPAQLRAAEIFRDNIPGAMKMLVEQEDSDLARQVFGQLASKYPQTPYGKYARVALSLNAYKQTFAQQNNKGGNQTWAPIADSLGDAASVFSGWHPMRERALFYASAADALAERYDEAESTIGELTAAFPAGKWTKRAAKLQAEIFVAKSSKEPD